MEVLVMEQEEFYEGQLKTTNQTRAVSKIIFLRSFQNWIKAMLIQEVTNKQIGMSILDLCCGKGGDLGKWKKACPSHYVGVDLSSSSVEEARRRYISSVVEKSQSMRDVHPAIFIVADGGDPQNLLTDILQQDPKLKRLK